MDFGSTFTKAALVDVDAGELVASASHRTTVDTDVLDGWDACLAVLVEADPRAASAEVLACSSAGGGLRIAVVGNEELVTAEAGRRVALSSGGRVVYVARGGGLNREGLRELAASGPDVILLVGGTDGGNAEVLVSCAATISKARWRGPVVVAGNVDARAEVSSLLDEGGTPHLLADNVVPQIGVLAPASARAAIREMFLRHVIGGKHLSERADPSLREAPGQRFTSMVRGATPDVVLTAVELLAHGLDPARHPEHPGAGDVVVVDVGGATTDVHSAVELPSTELGTGDRRDAALSRDVVATVPVSRTVEGDLGMRWSAVSTVEEGLAAGLLEPGGDAGRWRDAAEVRRKDPAFLPRTEDERHDDETIATAAVWVALRRHAGRRQVGFSGGDRVVERSGKDLRAVDVLVGSGGVLRNNPSDVADRVLATARGDDAPGGRQLPRAPRTVVDHDYVLAPAGLLAHLHPRAAHALLARLR